MVVSEPASADSAGTLDSITLTVVEPKATAAGLTQAAADLTQQLDDLSVQVDAGFTALQAQLDGVKVDLDAHLTVI